MSEYISHEHDVLVIGAGGAGLRAAVEASAAGVRVAVISKSLLGKAHTVMAEGGIAAAMGNVDDRDSWRVHFADTMRGGQYLNSWRMAEVHAKEAPACVRELEAWELFSIAPVMAESSSGISAGIAILVLRTLAIAPDWR